MVPVIDPGRRSPSSVIWRSTLLRCASSPGSVSDIGDTSSTLSVLYTFRQEAQKKATPHILTPVSRAQNSLLSHRTHFSLDFHPLQAHNPPESPLRRAVSNRSEAQHPLRRNGYSPWPNTEPNQQGEVLHHLLDLRTATPKTWSFHVFA